MEKFASTTIDAVVCFAECGSKETQSPIPPLIAQLLWMQQLPQRVCLCCGYEQVLSLSSRNVVARETGASWYSTVPRRNKKGRRTKAVVAPHEVTTAGVEFQWQRPKWEVLSPSVFSNILSSFCVRTNTSLAKQDEPFSTSSHTTVPQVALTSFEKDREDFEKSEKSRNAAPVCLFCLQEFLKPGTAEMHTGFFGREIAVRSLITNRRSHVQLCHARSGTDGIMYLGTPAMTVVRRFHQCGKGIKMLDLRRVNFEKYDPILELYRNEGRRSAHGREPSGKQPPPTEEVKFVPLRQHPENFDNLLGPVPVDGLHAFAHLLRGFGETLQQLVLKADSFSLDMAKIVAQCCPGLRSFTAIGRLSCGKGGGAEHLRILFEGCRNLQEIDVVLTNPIRQLLLKQSLFSGDAEPLLPVASLVLRGIETNAHGIVNLHRDSLKKYQRIQGGSFDDVALQKTMFTEGASRLTHFLWTHPKWSSNSTLSAAALYQFLFNSKMFPFLQNVVLHSDCFISSTKTSKLSDIACWTTFVIDLCAGASRFECPHLAMLSFKETKTAPIVEDDDESKAEELIIQMLDSSKFRPKLLRLELQGFARFPNAEHRIEFHWKQKTSLLVFSL